MIEGGYFIVKNKYISDYYILEKGDIYNLNEIEECDDFIIYHLNNENNENIVFVELDDIFENIFNKVEYNRHINILKIIYNQ